MDNPEYKYYAFISYSSKDTKWGKRLHFKMVRQKMPATLCSERGWKRRPMDPVFFAPYDIQPGGLSEELKQRLRTSKNLIVICSPNSARSEWVGKEIEYFYQLGRKDNIYFFIVEGSPNSGDPATECFNPVIRKLGLPEILGANIHERIYRCPMLNLERAYVQLISKLLGVEFDSIWKRHQRSLVYKAILWTIGILVVIASLVTVKMSNQQIDVFVSLNETSCHNPNLPPMENAIVTMILNEEIKSDTIIREGDNAVFVNIPHKYIGEKVKITFACKDYNPLDTIVTLTKTVSLKIKRDPNIYGNVRTEIWDFANNRPIINTTVWIDNFKANSDNEGIVILNIPLRSQRPRYQIRIPEYGITDSLTMPTNQFSSISISH